MRALTPSVTAGRHWEQVGFNQSMISGLSSKVKDYSRSHGRSLEKSGDIVQDEEAVCRLT